MKEIKPCPFCNGEARLVCEITLAIIYCPKCGIEYRKYATRLRDARRRVIEKWNRRS